MIEYENLYLLNRPYIQEYQKQFDSVLKNGWFILGDQVREFENHFAKYCGSKFCRGVGSGFDALTISLRSLNFKPGSEVIVPSNTYVATILSILNCGLRPVLVEPDLGTYNIDPQLIREAIGKKTVAIMVVHLYGKCCEMEEILRIAKAFDLNIIEDCAQAHGAKFKGKKAGSFGDFGAFSFYPTKNLGGLGDGGCLVTDRGDLDSEVSMLRNYGLAKKNSIERIGVNSRLDELQAAFLSIKLKSLDAINEHKRELASIYDQGLKDDFIRPQVHADYYNVYHIYNVRHPRRDKLREYLLRNDIITEIHYPLAPHNQPGLKDIFKNKSFPIAEQIHTTTLSLPLSTIHSRDDMQRVIEVMNKF